ncbi:MAG: AMP-binding protein [Chloroflexota bacterium]
MFNRSLPAWQQEIIDKCVHPTGTWEPFPESDYERSIPAKFEEIVERYPDQLAVVDHARALTYAELNAAVNRVAHGILAHLGPGPEPIVHLFDQHIDAVIALMGIIKAGKFYVPLDNRTTEAQLHGLLSTIESKLVLTDQASLSLVHAVVDDFTEHDTHRSPAICTINDLVFNQPDSSSENPRLATTPDDTIYVVFTSGSTGIPKGVIETHRNILHLAAIYCNSHHICPEDRSAMLNRVHFSGSKNSLFGTLLSGSSLYIYDIYQDGLAGIPQWIQQYRLTILSCTPPIFRFLSTQRTEASLFSSIRLLRVGGDRILPSDLDMFYRLLPESAIIRIGMGSSEVKAGPQILLDKSHAHYYKQMPAGWTSDHVTLCISTDKGYLYEPNIVGEIVLHTRFAAAGYWKQPELTSAKFQRDPHTAHMVYYHTGDLGWVDDEGCLYPLGRKDTQVKINGQLVVLGEIERVLLALDIISDAVVELQNNGERNQRLIAWLVSSEPCLHPKVVELRRYLAERLPTHMIPSHFVFLAQMPLNANNKVDRKALPIPDAVRPLTDTAFVASRGDVEERLRTIWAKILGFNDIGVHDNFFELGGHSMQAMQLVSGVDEQFQVKLPIHCLLETPTIAGLAERIQHEHKAAPRKQKLSLHLSSNTDLTLNDSFISLTPIQRKGDNRPIFFLPGGGGGEEEFLIYAPLIHLLGTEQPIYGFYARGVHTKDKPHQDVGQMASDYVRELRTVQPTGPYTIIGECSGGRIAYEMARHLQAQGESVDSLILMNTNLRPLEKSISHQQQRIQHHRDQLKSMSLQQKLGYILSRSVVLQKRILPLTREQRHSEQQRATRLHYTNLLSHYRPTAHYDGPVSMIVSTDDYQPNLFARWQALIHGEIQQYQVPGSRQTYLGTHVHITARQLRDCLDIT